jgi:hypothetical protein
MRIEYKTESDKNRLLQETINGICNNLKVTRVMDSNFFKNAFLSTPKFDLFKTTIQDAKNGTNIDDQKSKAREAIDIWDFKVNSEPLSNYLKLLQEILDLFRDKLKVYHVWIKYDDSRVLQTIEESKLLRQEHFTRRPDPSGAQERKPDDVNSIESVPSAPKKRRGWLEPAPRAPKERKSDDVKSTESVPSAPKKQKPDDVKSTEPAPRGSKERKTAEVKSADPASRDVTTLLRELQELIDKYIPAPPISHEASETRAS